MKIYSIPTTLTATMLVALVSLNATAHEAGDWILRIGAVNVAVDASSSTISTAATGALAGTAVSVGDNSQLGLNLMYMWSDNIGIEALAATPFEHDISAAGLDQYGYSTTDIGSSKHLPPTFSALYFLGNSSSAFRPYVGVGVNYTTFFSTSLSNDAKTELGAHNLDLDDSFGLTVRAGFDWQLFDNWMLNASVWKIDIDTDASFDSALGKVKVGVDLDPWVYMISLGYKF
ncbi:MAG: outer membrane protein OmpW [SAR86 cluster bacterium]|uniref:Outer membrane protein OmpW n=1 Tax=SAR86 cluster bacterium TaxID=2030880 RepID=A0A2A4MRN4_9GAMM|nr:MAG: outer membrane protein OmpW [SAR86 cluster bacterium]